MVLLANLSTQELTLQWLWEAAESQLSQAFLDPEAKSHPT